MKKSYWRGVRESREATHRSHVLLGSHFVTFHVPTLSYMLIYAVCKKQIYRWWVNLEISIGILICKKNFLTILVDLFIGPSERPITQMQIRKNQLDGIIRSSLLEEYFIFRESNSVLPSSKKRNFFHSHLSWFDHADFSMSFCVTVPHQIHGIITQNQKTFLHNTIRYNSIIQQYTQIFNFTFPWKIIIVAFCRQHK